MVNRVKQGDIITLDFDPQSGHEQKGRRPAIVISCDLFNSHNKMTLVCPITSSPIKSPFQVAIDKNSNIVGTILCDQIKSLDIYARNYRLIGHLDDETMIEVLDIINCIINK